MADIFHITHLKNISSVLQRGGLCCDNIVAEETINPIVIGYADLKGRRSQRTVPVEPRGTLSDYVPFYFAPRSPMLYVISKGGVPGYNDGQEQVLHLVTSTDQVQQNELEFVFTDGQAYVEFSRFFKNTADLNQIDWSIMKEQYWRDTREDGDRRRRRNAEFLVHRFFPWPLIKEIGVMNKRIAQVLEPILESATHRPIITVRAEWYY